ncbi:MAG: hypothetical protein G8345_14065 [Magnetococcales bacterium]|nr:hypothetical protein [Magnetococcales bacterium]NGZ28002.1 hypothetical protein [Magnetococcales bacterium]
MNNVFQFPGIPKSDVTTKTLSVDDLDSGTIYLKAMRGSGVLTQADYIFPKIPSLGIAVKRAGVLMTRLVPGEGGRPLLDQCIARGIHALANSSDITDLSPEAEICQVRLFVREFAITAMGLFQWRVGFRRTDGSYQFLEPLDEALSLWLKRKQAHHVILIPEPHRVAGKPALPFIIASKVFLTNDLLRIGALDVEMGGIWGGI